MFSKKTIDMLADIGRKYEKDKSRCTYISGGVRCCRELNHNGSHFYKCCSDNCPGYPWLASNVPHPKDTCN